MNDNKINLLEAPFELSYKYKRSSGPVMSKFFEGLSQKKIFGTKSKAQKVFAPAAEYDPDTREALTEIVEVGPAGTIESWSWINSPRSHHLLKTPFAFALIKLDGADTSMLHMVTDCMESELSIGTRVVATWSDTHEQRITDIKFFKLES